MKYLPIIGILFLAGCTVIPTPHGQAQFWGDYANVQLDDGSVHFLASGVNHSHVARVHWNGASNIGAEVASGMIGLHAGTQALGAVSTAVTPIVNRPTDRTKTTTP